MSEQKLLELGSEDVYSGFSQIKNRIGEKLILNVGFRFDNKKRLRGPRISNLSPRLALIYLANDNFDMKVSYSQSFVDAPYWYRYNNLLAYSGSENLNPEILSAMQITSTVSSPNKKFNNGLTFFVNRLTDFLYRDNEATGDEPRYINAGGLRSWGLENEFAFTDEAYSLRANSTYQRVISADRYPVIENRIMNVPSVVANAIFDFKPPLLSNDDLRINFTARYIGNQVTSIASSLKRDGAEDIVESVLIFNGGLRLRNILNNLSLNLSVYNLADTDYYQGGSVNHPYPQPNRWYMIKLEYESL